VPPTPAMTDMMVKIIVEVLDILGTATKEMKQSRASELILFFLSLGAHMRLEKFLKKIAGITKLEDGLKKLDKMTNEEARMASAESLRICQTIDKKVDVVDERVQGVGRQVMDVDERVQDVSGQVKDIDEKVEEVDTKVQGVDEKVQGVGEQVRGVEGDVKVVGDKVQTVIDGA
jgi:methyl-accepting chemotaxis protein